MWCLLLVFVLSSVTVSSKFHVIDNVDVRTADGWVRGQQVQDESGRTYEEFLGIPFAAPPVDNMRWQKPGLVEPWDGVRDATRYSRHCTQFIAPAYLLLGMGIQQGEDCLYLNVFVPHGVSNVENLPVMVYYYGGAFILGTAEMYSGHDLALHGDMVVVTFNYRVSTLGWLSSGSDVLPGNYGLWDARAALIWVQANIGNFGGNPDMVTIFGQSAGAALVSHSVISPPFKHLFHRAIAISGGSNAFFGTGQMPLRSLQTMSEVFSCNTQDASEIVECLRQEDARALDLQGILGEVLLGERLPGFLPVVDGELIHQDPYVSFQEGVGKDIDFMTGITNHDGAGFILLNPLGTPGLGQDGGFAATPESLRAFWSLVLGFASNAEELIDIMYLMYPDMSSENNLTRTMGATESSTDWWFGTSSYYEATEHARNAAVGGGGSTYNYRFNYAQTFLGYPDWVVASHLDDVYSVFGVDFMGVYIRLLLGESWQESDLAVSNTWMDYITNFAYTGNPNEGKHPVPVEWPAFEPGQDQRFVMTEQPYVETVPEEQADLYRFWIEDFKHQIEYSDTLKSFLTENGSQEHILDTLLKHIKDNSLQEDITAAIERLKALKPDH